MQDGSDIGELQDGAGIDELQDGSEVAHSIDSTSISESSSSSEHEQLGDEEFLPTKSESEGSSGSDGEKEEVKEPKNGFPVHMPMHQERSQLPRYKRRRTH